MAVKRPALSIPASRPARGRCCHNAGSFSRRRCTEEGIRIASRYFATVRRAISTPSRCKQLDDPLVRQRVGGRFAVDQAADPMTHRFRGMGAVAGRIRDRRREEILQLVEAARRRHVLVAGHPADRALVHADRLGDVAKDQRPQRLHAAAEEAVLLANDLRSDLEDRRGALMQRFDQPVSGLPAARSGSPFPPCCGWPDSPGRSSCC